MDKKLLDTIIGGLLPIGILGFISQIYFAINIWGQLVLHKIIINWNLTNSILLRLIPFIIASFIFFIQLKKFKEYKKEFIQGYLALSIILAIGEFLMILIIY